jgi:hypothetical protein
LFLELNWNRNVLHLPHNAAGGSTSLSA